MDKISGIKGGYVMFDGDEFQVKFPIGRVSGPAKKSEIAEILTVGSLSGIVGPFVISSNGLVVKISEGTDLVSLYHHEIFNAVT